MSIANKKGVDISSNNGSVSFDKIKAAGYDFVMIRCGYGSDIKSQDDSQFEANVKKAESLGLPWGVYLYSYACNTDEAKSEAEHIKRLLKGKKPTLPIALDMEDADGYKKNRGALSKSNITAICKTFLSAVKSAGFYPMLYTSLSWLDYYIESSVYKSYDLWVAQWNSTCDYKGTNLGLWQYGGETNFLESNSIAGVGVIDKDKVYKDYPTIIKDGGYNGWKKKKADSPSTPTKTAETAPNVTYKVRTNSKWLPEVKNSTDFAGIAGQAITDVAIKVDKGSVKYRVHVKGGDWLPYVTGYNTSDLSNGYAGNGKEIDAVEIIYYTDTAKNSKYYYATYRVSPVGKSYYDWQKDNIKASGMDGYAGSFGKAIDRLQIKLTA